MTLRQRLKNKLEEKYKFKTGDLVKDIGDGFSSVEDPGIVIELFPARYEYRHPLFLGLFKINMDGILVRWLDKKGTTHVYPACCVEKMVVSEEKAEQLRTTAEERFDKPKEPPEPPFHEKQLDIFESLGLPSDEITDNLPMPLPPEPVALEEPFDEDETKPSLNRAQDTLREVERIIKERTEDDEE